MSVKHVVMFKFKDETPQQKVDELIAEYRALPAKIELMKGFEWGPDISVEGQAHGFTHCFIATFDSVVGRDAYIPHEAHQAYVEGLLPYLADILVVDFEPQD